MAKVPDRVISASRDQDPAIRRRSPQATEAPDNPLAEADAVADAFVAQAAAHPSRLHAVLSSADGAARARALSRLQRAQGNTFVQRLLAQRGSSRNGERAIQRQGEGDVGTAGLSPSPEYQLKLDPEIEAKMRALQLLRVNLDPSLVKTSFAQARPPWLPKSPPATGPIPSGPKRPKAGPAEPKKADTGDLWDAISSLPMVERALARLQALAMARLERDYGRLSTGEKALAITTTALIGGGALAGAISDPDARRFAVDQLNGRILPIPGVKGLSAEVNTTGGNLMIGLHLDVGALLPESLGFGPSSPKPIGGPPKPEKLPGGL